MMSLRVSKNQNCVSIVLRDIKPDPDDVALVRKDQRDMRVQVPAKYSFSIVTEHGNQTLSFGCELPTEVRNAIIDFANYVTPYVLAVRSSNVTMGYHAIHWAKVYDMEVGASTSEGCLNMHTAILLAYEKLYKVIAPIEDTQLHGVFNIKNMEKQND